MAASEPIPIGIMDIDPKVELTDERIEQARRIIADVMGVPLEDVTVTAEGGV